MKYWRKRIVYMMAIMLSAGGIAGSMGSEIVLAEEKETVKGRYAAVSYTHLYGRQTRISAW